MTANYRFPDEQTRAIYEFAAAQLKAGLSAPKIEAKLVEKGLSQSTASQVVKNLLGMRSKAKREAGKNDMTYGGLWFVLGVVVTVVSFTFAKSGGTFVVASGAIVVGSFQLLRGIYRYLTA